MKRLIVDVYIILYRITRIESFSLIFAIAYITLLNLISIFGLGLLLQGWMPTGFIRKAFLFPYCILTAIIMFLLNLWMMSPVKNLSKERRKTPYYPSIIAYTVITMILCVYIYYRDKLPN